MTGKTRGFRFWKEKNKKDKELSKRRNGLRDKRRPRKKMMKIPAKEKI